MLPWWPEAGRLRGDHVRAKRLEKPLTNPGMRSMACGGGFHIKAVAEWSVWNVQIVDVIAV
jgi:hypothetical protein